MNSKINSYILLLGLLLSSCLAEQPNPLVIPTCFDNIRNQDETGVDCGGRCKACRVILESPCKATLVNNRIVYKNTNLNLTGSDISFTDRFDTFEIFIRKGGIIFLIDIFTDRLPVDDTLFPVTTSSYREGYANIWVSENDQYATSGNVYVLYDPDKETWSIEFCSVPLKRSGSTVTNSLTGRIIY